MNPETNKKWNPAKKFGFRFIFVFLTLVIFQMFTRFFLGKDDLDFLYYPSFIVQNYVLQLHEIPVWNHTASGGADTLDDWVQQLAYLLLSLLAAGIWTLIDRKRKEYKSLYRWTKIGVRYFLASVMLLYGLNKLFLVQMIYPQLSYFYTPLGDFKPMDLAWTFVGYSAAYQFIGGLLEFVSAILIFFRRTLVLGLLIFLGVMSNVLMLNYLYGVAVKTFSTTLVIMGLFLLFEYIPKIVKFLIFQRATKIEVRELHFRTPWKKKARLILKYGYIAFALVVLTIRNYRVYSKVNRYSPITIEGAYDVHSFEVNATAITNYFDDMRWNQVVVNPSPDGMSSSGHVSLGTTRRELATFEIDSLDQLRITFDKDSSMVFRGSHRTAGDTFVWAGQIGRDSIKMILKKNERSLPLHETPFKLIIDVGDQENLRTRK